MCIQFFRPRATTRIELWARLLLNSSSENSNRVSFFQSASTHWRALLNALEGSAMERAASISTAPNDRARKPYAFSSNAVSLAGDPVC